MMTSTSLIIKPTRTRKTTTNSFRTDSVTATTFDRRIISTAPSTHETKLQPR